MIDNCYSMTNSTIIRVAGKADTLTRLNETKRFLIPESFVFTVSDWDADKENVVRRIINQFADGCIAVRSSSIFEDSEFESMAGAYLSSLDVRPRYHDVVKAIEDTIGSYGDKASPNNQILNSSYISTVNF